MHLQFGTKNDLKVDTFSDFEDNIHIFAFFGGFQLFMGSNFQWIIFLVNPNLSGTNLIGFKSKHHHIGWYPF